MRLVAACVMTLTLLLAGCSGDGESAEASTGLAGALPESFPADFPLPPDATVASTGDALTLHVDDSVDDVNAFYADELPAAGWTITQSWDGVDAVGAPAIGFTFEREEEVGVLSISEVDDLTTLRINLHHPLNDPNRGMNVPGPRTPPEGDD
jgi:hypothetical protein